MTIIPGHRRPRQEVHEFENHLGYTVVPCLKRAKSKRKKIKMEGKKEGEKNKGRDGERKDDSCNFLRIGLTV